MKEAALASFFYACAFKKNVPKTMDLLEALHKLWDYTRYAENS